MGKGDHSKTFLLLALFYYSTPKWLKVRGGSEQGAMWWVVAHVILVSPQSQLDLDFDLGLLWV